MKNDPRMLPLLKKIPFVLPLGTIIDGKDVGNYVFTVRTYNLRNIYLSFRYENPNNDSGDFIFNSKHDIDELLHYLYENNLLLEKLTKKELEQINYLI